MTGSERREHRHKGSWDRLRRMPEAICVCLLFLIQLAVFLIFWDRSYPQIHDNLDLFMPHYRMMKLKDAWFAHGVTLPVMHGLTRDLFGSCSTMCSTFSFPTGSPIFWDIF